MPLIRRLTTVAAVLFMLTSLTLTIMISRPGAGSVIRSGAEVPTIPNVEIEQVLPEMQGLPLSRRPTPTNSQSSEFSKAEVVELAYTLS